jgi:hypothetical protein
VYALTFAWRIRYNTSKLPSDGASAVTDRMRWIYGLVIQLARILGSFSRGSLHATQQCERLEGVSASSRGGLRPDPFG